MHTISAHLRGRREKAFDGRWVPLDRNAKVRVMTLARALMRRTEPGKAYGAISAKAMAVLQALLWGFHNARDGRCFPAYEAIAARADCARSTVAVAIRALEDAALITWCNRIVRVREGQRDLFGRVVGRWRVMRTSNGYCFIDPKPDPKPSKSDFKTGTPVQDSISDRAAPNPALEAALARLGRALGIDPNNAERPPAAGLCEEGA